MSADLGARFSAYYYLDAPPSFFDAHSRMIGCPKSWLETLNAVVITSVQIRDAYAAIVHIGGEDEADRLRRAIVLFSYADEQSILPIDKSGYALYERVIALRRWVMSTGVEQVLNPTVLYDIVAGATLVEINDRIELDSPAFAATADWTSVFGELASDAENSKLIYLSIVAGWDEVT